MAAGVEGDDWINGGHDISAILAYYDINNRVSKAQDFNSYAEALAGHTGMNKPLRSHLNQKRRLS